MSHGEEKESLSKEKNESAKERVNPKARGA